MRPIKSYLYVAVRAFLSPHPESGIPAVRVAILCLMAFTSCIPSGLQPSTPNTQSPKIAGSGATEINNALATIAMQTSLPMADYQIGPEDLLEVTLYNMPESEGKLTPRTLRLRVSHQGLISLPLIGPVKVAGLTAANLEAELIKRFDKYIYSPQVGVLVAEYRQRVSVIGAVQKAGIIELTGPKTVIDILSMAGGVSDKAGTQVHVYRQGPKGRENQVIDLIALASNAALINASNAALITMPVQSGDIINVPPAGTFFVDGAVKNPGPYALGRRYTLTQALVAAGGVDRDFYSPDITIFRRKGTGGMEPMPFDFNAIRDGSVSDPLVEADDVIVVPISSVKYVYHRVFGQLLGWGTTFAAFAGS